ncbi:RcnB family protein [Novosphingobium sp.]|uniref:RcnB family protein n=1 Tax=Novosphingobium sp. TaxID=1874826 RepID=UPI002736BD90|nr:RcnB family protein [Novosphingobium sp.]MDP3906856.1 RcnB family protein [Novosphingobium sp.]
MAVKKLGMTGRISTLALAIAALTLPGLASAQEEGRGRRGDSEAAGNISGSYQPPQRSAPRENRGDSGRDSGNGWTRPAARSAPVAVPAPAAAPTANMSDRRGGTDGARGSWRGRESGGAPTPGVTREWRGNGAGMATVPVPQPAPRAATGTTWTGAATANGTGYRNDDRRGVRTETRTRTEDRRTDGWRAEDRRSEARGADVWRNDRNRDDRRDTYRSTDRRDDSRYRNDSWNRDRGSYKQDYRRWDNRWRDNHRYNWSSYRRTNPSIYRMGSYYSPYRNYSYRPLSIGFFMDSLFFSSNYWINDPWQYRLPDVYGPYRWVRYYDDALLVNVYSGEVVDVIRNFFW